MRPVLSQPHLQHWDLKLPLAWPAEGHNDQMAGLRLGLGTEQRMRVGKRDWRGPLGLAMQSKAHDPRRRGAGGGRGVARRGGSLVHREPLPT